jgi:hypothetical protein
MAERLPVPMKAIQVDGGSEFMAVFEEVSRPRIFGHRLSDPCFV